MKSQPLKQISVIIIEDHRMFREQLAHLIDKADDMKVCGQADNIRDGLALIKQTQPEHRNHRYHAERLERPGAIEGFAGTRNGCAHAYPFNA